MKEITASNYRRDYYYRRIVPMVEPLLLEHGAMASLTVVTNLGLIPVEGLRDWQGGQAACLEDVIPKPDRVRAVLRVLQLYAGRLGLKPLVVPYFWAQTADSPRAPLFFTEDRDAKFEALYSNHYVAPLMGSPPAWRPQGKVTITYDDPPGPPAGVSQGRRGRGAR